MLKCCILLMLVFMFVGSCCFRPFVYPNYNIIENKEIHIKSRIVIEFDLVNRRMATDIDKITKDIDFAENLYKEIGLKIDIEKIEVFINGECWDKYFNIDANKHENVLSIYYSLNRSCDDKEEKYCGMAVYPWDMFRTGIVIHGPSSGINTLAHELGHYFGLKHTFDKFEYFDDTPNEQEYEKQNPGLDYHFYPNIMNYTRFPNFATVTPMQLSEMKFYIFTTRSKVIDWNK